MNLWTSLAMSSTSAHYIILIVDDHTSFLWIYLLNIKAQAHYVFVSYMNMIEMKFSIKLKVLQTNAREEFKFWTHN